MLNLECISLSTMSSVAFPKAAVICLGDFDGVHLAHRALITRAKALRDKQFPQAALCAFCFRESSKEVLSGKPIAQLTTMEEKLTKFYETGVEYVFLCDFTAIKAYSPKDFAVQILSQQCNCSAAVCGYNYRFGKMGVGTPSLLAELLEVPVEVEQEVREGGVTVSSTLIREFLMQGKVEQAASLLCAPYSFTAEIVHGKALGKTIGFPTLNQYFPPKKLIPKNGVYLTRCTVGEEFHYGISNVGVHPTVDKNAALNCETHLIGVCKNLYGKVATVSFLAFLRPEQKFDSTNALCEQIKDDLYMALTLIKQMKG